MVIRVFNALKQPSHRIQRRFSMVLLVGPTVLGQTPDFKGNTVGSCESLHVFGMIKKSLEVNKM